MLRFFFYRPREKVESTPSLSTIIINISDIVPYPLHLLYLTFYREELRRLHVIRITNMDIANTSFLPSPICLLKRPNKLITNNYQGHNTSMTNFILICFSNPTNALLLSV